MRGFIFLLIVGVSGCSKNIDSALTSKDLIAEFSKHEQQYKKLRDMVTADANELQKFEVGIHRLGDYRLYDDGWAKQYGNYISLEAILAEYSLTQSRLQEYLTLLSATGASVVERHKDSVSISISSSGFVFGGCLSQIHYEPNVLTLEKPSWAQVYYKAKFYDNWGGETKCD
ncbi:MAG: hypothetical protein CL590_00020 [Alteromonadaceae bacterium]|nr:hypothetical protein [Alteromonadaceae bacterium]